MHFVDSGALGEFTLRQSLSKNEKFSYIAAIKSHFAQKDHFHINNSCFLIQPGWIQVCYGISAAPGRQAVREPA
jgi:hypothetical protein